VWHLRIYIYIFILLGPHAATFNRRVFSPILHAQALIVHFIVIDFLIFLKKVQRGLQSLEGLKPQLDDDYRFPSKTAHIHPNSCDLIQFPMVGDISGDFKHGKITGLFHLELPFNERLPNSKNIA
jgi:hypothetical protein